MVTPQDILTVLTQLERGKEFYATLNILGISPLAFIRFLEQSPEAAAQYKVLRQLITEQDLMKAIGEIDGVSDELELKKVSLKIKTHQWLAEKLVPETYGAKVEVSVTKTINIVRVLEEARARVFIESVVVPELSADNNSQVISGGGSTHTRTPR